jgi:putative restriction endonuclease
VTDEKILDAFRSIRSWVSGDHRAPHKPLLLLIALAELQRNGGRWIAYNDIEPKLRQLLSDFGPPRRAIHPEYPFWRLTSDELWEVKDANDIKQTLTSSGDVPVTVLRRRQAKAGFTEPFFETLHNRPELMNRAAALLLEQTFPRSLHTAILDAIGYPWVPVTRARRDPEFRAGILRIYEHRCAVCGFDGRLGGTDLGLEAAHIKWFASGGPDTFDNGLALCVFHHHAFDRGAFSLNDELLVIVSKDVYGQNHLDELLLRYNGRPLRPPQAGEPRPDRAYIEWHRREVFWSPPRSFAAPTAI